MITQYKKAFTFLREKLGATYWKCLICFLVITLITAVVVKNGIGIEKLAGVFLKIFGDSSDTVYSVVSVEEEMTWYGFLIHNGEADLWTMLSGVVPFVFLPFFVLLFNGVLLGFTTGAVTNIYSCSLLKAVIFGVAPHGILEYAVNILSLALGVYFCKTITNTIRKKEYDNWKTAKIDCVRMFVLIVLPGLLIAGIIEAELTPLIVNWAFPV